ncbi:MAG: insulinase family protein, partial [Halobacteriovoraceae bacterium]|nr:insulinase family protein [Halobacteriovoraceae bacterium]
MHHEQVKLKNDLQTLFIDFPGSTAASVQIWFRAGSALETGNDKGIAHFLEHMFFKGTKKRPGSAMAHEIESFGGELNAFTSFDYTCYYANSPNSQLDKTIEILMDMVSNPLFEQSELEPERDVVFEEYRRSQDNPGQYSFQKLQNACFTAGYSHPILGNEKTIKNFTREQLIKFRSAFYCNSNALLVVAGDLKKKPKLIKTIESFSLPKGNPTLFPKFKLKTKEATQIHQKDVRMAQVYMSIQAPAFSDKGAAAEDLAFNCLGHGESSYLYKSLVTDGSIANTSSSSTMFMAKGGVHFIRVVFPIDNQTKVFNILAKVVEELLTNGIDNKEVQKIKNQYLSTKVYEMESLESYAFSLGHGFAQAGDINSEEDFVNRIKATSNFAVNRAYKDIFNRPMHICLQLPNDASVPKIKKTISAFRSKLEKIKAKSNKLSQSKFSVKTSQFDPQVKWIKIKEGVTLIHRKNPLNPTFVLHAYVRGGLTDETKLTNGSHSLIASLVTQGYAGTNMEKLKALLDDRSANLHGFSGKNAYGLTMHGQS